MSKWWHSVVLVAALACSEPAGTGTVELGSWRRFGVTPTGTEPFYAGFGVHNGSNVFVALLFNNIPLPSVSAEPLIVPATAGSDASFSFIAEQMTDGEQDGLGFGIASSTSYVAVESAGFTNLPGAPTAIDFRGYTITSIELRIARLTHSGGNLTYDATVVVRGHPQ